MALSNTATPKYYGMFREAVMRGAKFQSVKRWKWK